MRAGARTVPRSSSRATSSAYSGFPPDPRDSHEHRTRERPAELPATSRCNAATDSGPSSSRSSQVPGTSRQRAAVTPGRIDTTVARTRSLTRRRTANSTAPADGGSSQRTSSTASTTSPLDAELPEAARATRSPTRQAPPAAGSPASAAARSRAPRRCTSGSAASSSGPARRQQVGEPGERELRLGLGRPRCAAPSRLQRAHARPRRPRSWSCRSRARRRSRGRRDDPARPRRNASTAASSDSRPMMLVTPERACRRGRSRVGTGRAARLRRRPADAGEVVPRVGGVLRMGEIDLTGLLARLEALRDNPLPGAARTRPAGPRTARDGRAPPPAPPGTSARRRLRHRRCCRDLDYR